uniref:Differentiation-related protein Infp n=1 Tax=Uromyces appendiculatus TaxID=5264 RepID=Q9Y8A0_UROAP|nr:differentiation-related protein Infp [Uromyces appendiculatus]
MSSWQSLSKSFSQCQTAFSEHRQVEVVYTSVQTLYQSYQTTVKQYDACTSCATYLSHSDYTSQFRQTLTQMYTSFHSIVSIGSQDYSAEWQNRFSSTFQSMSSFGKFSLKVCAAVGIDLGSLLKSTGLNLEIFANLGINLGLGGILGAVGGIVGGILGGSGSGGNGLLGNLLG